MGVTFTELTPRCTLRGKEQRPTPRKRLSKGKHSVPAEKHHTLAKAIRKKEVRR